MDDELKAILEALRQDNVDMRKENAEMHAETRRHFEILMEASNHKIELLAEGVALTREELARTTTALDEKIDRTAAETQAMLKFSHVDLDRRMRTLETSQSKLEDTVEDLQTRIERLEGSTH
ncbi:MAG: hypothetical protein QOH21_733 [Acidobacteriota bacterium]|jgi:hypothetical protein|nr:hypothetical protein [Acidobacteriota bacterium]